MIPTVEAMAGPVSLELDPIFLKGLSYLHSKSKDSAEKLKALLDESLARGSDSSYRSLQKVSGSKGFILILIHILSFYCSFPGCVFFIFFCSFVCFCK